MKQAKSVLLKCEALSVGYTSSSLEKPIVEDANLQLKPGMFTTLVGINGSGKSTLLRSLAGLQKPLSGSVILNDNPLTKLSTDARSKSISVVLTGQQISKNLSVLELVTLGRQPYTNWLGKLSTHDKEHIDQAIASTQLEALQHTPCYALSDGQFQRALIARALAQDTPIIMLDEPTTHLDLHHKASIFTLLSEIAHKHHKTVLCTTHDIELVLSLCDEMIVIQNKKAQQNTPQQLIADGVFNQLFPSNRIGFDQNSRRFFIK